MLHAALFFCLFFFFLVDRDILSVPRAYQLAGKEMSSIVALICFLLMAQTKKFVLFLHISLVLPDALFWRHIFSKYVFLSLVILGTTISPTFAFPRCQYRKKKLLNPNHSRIIGLCLLMLLLLGNVLCESWTKKKGFSPNGAINRSTFTWLPVFFLQFLDQSIWQARR